MSVLSASLHDANLGQQQAEDRARKAEAHAKRCEELTRRALTEATELQKKREEAKVCLQHVKSHAAGLEAELEIKAKTVRHRDRLLLELAAQNDEQERALARRDRLISKYAKENIALVASENTAGQPLLCLPNQRQLLVAAPIAQKAAGRRA